MTKENKKLIKEKENKLKEIEKLSKKNYENFLYYFNDYQTTKNYKSFNLYKILLQDIFYYQDKKTEIKEEIKELIKYTPF
ncbi:hypothetical protein [Aliarcobacter butzleri]|uniref:hypothetical protein n=1 Tax=Aliarcobacter butzleri TaxID=28197 RepID=UPI002B24657C|nr:hypothetical protein [Aliarcobacter butzleri]